MIRNPLNLAQSNLRPTHAATLIRPGEQTVRSRGLRLVGLSFTGPIPQVQTSDASNCAPGLAGGWDRTRCHD